MNFLHEQSDVIQEIVPWRQTLVPPQLPEPEPTLGQTIVATVQRENLIGSFLSSHSFRSPFEQIRPDFDIFTLADPSKPHNPASNPFIYLDGMDRDPDTMSKFIGARDPQHALDIASDIRRERHNNDVIQRSGWTGTVMSFAAGIADPLIFVPGIGIAKGAKGGISIARSAYLSAALGGGVVATQELGFQMTQQDRTKTESAARITGGVLLSGILGAAFSGMSKGAYAVATKQLEDAVEMRGSNIIDTAATSAKGAAESDDVALVGFGGVGEVKPADVIAGGDVNIKGALGLQHALKYLSPRLQGFMAQSPTMRGITNKMLIAPMMLEKGINSGPIEARTSLAFGAYSSALDAQDRLYTQMITGGKRMAPNVWEKIKGFGKREGQMSRGEFSQQVSYAMRRHGTPDFDQFPDAVKNAAKVYLDIRNPMAKRAVDTGTLPKEVLDNLGYLNRQYNKQLLASNPNEQVKLAEAIAGATIQKAEAQGKKLTSSKAMVGATKAVKKIMTSDPTRPLPSDIGKRGVFLDRTIDVPDQVIERWLISDADRLMKSYVRSMVADTEIAASFGLGRARDVLKTTREALVFPEGADAKAIDAVFKARDDKIAAQFGGKKLRGAMSSSRESLVRKILKGKNAANAIEERDANLVARFNTGDGALAIDKIEEYWRPKIRLAQTSDLKAASRMTKQAKKELTLFRNYRDELRGMLGVPDDPTALTPRIMKAVRQWTFMALGGNIMLSSINDIALPIFNYGMGDVFETATSAFARDGSAIIRKMAMEDARLALGSSELILNTHVNKLWDIADGIVPTTKFERGMEEATKIYSAIGLISPWTQMTKDMSAMNAQGFIIRTAMMVAKDKKVAKWRAARIRELGFNDDDLRTFAQQWLKHGEEDGFRDPIAPNTKAWSDQAAAEKLRLGVIKAKTFDVIGGTALDRPIIPGVSQDFSRLLFQFSSYGLNVGTRVAGRALQYRDAQVATGVMSMMGLSMMAVMLKDKIAGKERDFKNLVAESVRQSPATGLLFDTSKYIEFATRGKIGIAPLLDLKSGNRYYSADTVLSAMLGPSVGIIQNIAQSAADATDLDLDEGTVGRIRRSVPLNNMFYFRRLFDSLQEKGKEYVAP